jgi:hypothetical protein
MRIEILVQAARDLIEGFRFYEDQGAGLGSYFLPISRLTSTLDMLLPAFTASLTSSITVSYRDAFLSLFFTR